MPSSSVPATAKELMKCIGFGAARLATSPAHERALAVALEKGIRVIDTAPNYGHEGASERVIGRVLAANKATIKREDIVLCTKFGYYRSQATPGPESVAISTNEAGGLYYSLHPQVMEQELRGSLDRLQQDYLDTFYVHNPEHYLADILLRQEQQRGSPPTDPSELLQEEKIKLKDRLVRVFEALEGVVDSGRIRRYGVSSNGFALNPKESLHLSLDVILEAAVEGAKRAGKTVPALQAIQLPVNLLEPSGLVVAAKAKAKGLDVVANRPLTAVAQGALYRLVNTAAAAGRKPPEGYMEACRAALDLFNPTAIFEGKTESQLTEEEKEVREGCRIIQELIREMNKQLTSFTSMEVYSQELERRIIPLIASTFESLDEEAADRLQSFFHHYGEMVRYNAAARVVDVCRGAGHVLKDQQLLHHYALQWLLEKVPNQLSTVLVGMPQEAYVQDIVEMVSRT